ncbi:4466_t:CDS:2, partial [Funneliformis geosporum]
LQMKLRRTLLTPAERESLAYDIPQTGPMASIVATIILTLIVHELQSFCEIENYSTAITMNLFLWLVASALSFTRYISYNLSASLFFIDTIHDCIQLIGIAITIQYFH